MTMLAVWVGKLTLMLLRLIGRRGNALPGLVVERLFPRYLPGALATLPQGVVVVSGTNGKTTTTKMVATLLGEQYRVLTNDTGSNFVRGAITTCIERSTWSGRLPFDVAVFELDEAWAVKFCEVVAPQRCLLLNVMRDQLDRFGEIDATAALLGKVARATTADVVLNRDDPRIAALSAGVTGAALSYYGVAPQLRPSFPNDEELYGGAVYVSDKSASAELVALGSAGGSGEDSAVTLRVGAQTRRVRLQTQGAHNAQNAAGAAALALSFGMTAEAIFAGLEKIQPAFGRGQRYQLHGRDVVLHLVKNPAGFRQSLRVLDGAAPAAVVIAINDDYADGRDMSWLWDVEYASVLTPVIASGAKLITSGTRASDMALRLHYDGITADVVEEDLAQAVRRATELGHGEVIVFSTYTAMWELHAFLEKQGSVAV